MKPQNTTTKRRHLQLSPFFGGDIWATNQGDKGDIWATKATARHKKGDTTRQHSRRVVCVSLLSHYFLGEEK